MFALLLCLFIGKEKVFRGAFDFWKHMLRGTIGAWPGPYSLDQYYLLIIVINKQANNINIEKFTFKHLSPF